MKKYAFFLIISVFALALFMGCSGGDDDDVIVNPPEEDTLIMTETIGPDGGTIEIAGEVVLEIYEGALTDSVEFSIVENDSPSGISPPLRFVSPCYTIEPSGIVFDSNTAELSITYYDSLLTGGAVEDSIVLYTWVDSAWEPLATDVDTLHNIVSSDIFHLCDFAAAADTTSPPPPPVYAELFVARTFLHDAGGDDTTDVLSAFFNSGYSPGGPYTPLQADSVKCNEFPLPWDESRDMHVYDGTEIIELNSDYVFVVFASDDVPELEDTIPFPDREPDITSPTYDEAVSISGFTVQWSDFGGGGQVQVQLVLRDSAGVVFDIQVPNNGAYPVTEDDYDRTPGVDVELYLIFENRSLIDVEGYHSESFVAGRVVSIVVFRLE